MATTISVSPKTTGSLPKSSVKNRFTTESLEEPPTIIKSSKSATLCPASSSRWRNNALIFENNGTQSSNSKSSSNSAVYSFPSYSSKTLTFSRSSSSRFACSVRQSSCAHKAGASSCFFIE